MDDLASKNIALLLSGGVDSSVALYELVRQGVRPDCFYIKIGPEEEEEWDCSSEEDLEMATAVSHKYGCKLEVIDCHREYWEQVTTYTMSKVRAGLTPNPDVMCNRLIKFGAFHEKQGHAYDLIATGHYAQTEEEEEKIVNSKSSNSKLTWLCTSPDPVKDQTDFLAQIYDWQLAKALFPIGHMMKEEVRQIAEREHLAPAHRRDSQGICFLGKINYNDYLRRYLGEQPGDIVELETGRKLGQHRGHWFHTIGQRKGLGLGGGPWFIVKKDINENILYVSHGYDPATAYRQVFSIRDFHSLNGQLPPAGVTLKIRHTPEFLPARLEASGNGQYTVRAEAPIHGVAPGQFCVIYDADHHRCYGSGEISL
ncbi:MAG: tRNA 2-thiouridine(34) synthase MnmA [Prevotella sp.]|nr:tRNA 2-thiouridine(34) synthase MnmA [Prevotella sp.]